MKHIKEFSQFLNEEKIPVLTDKSSWEDIQSYLKWLAKSKYQYHIDDDPRDIPNFDKKTQDVLAKNSEIMWGYNDRPENKSISDRQMMDMIWDAYPWDE
jgi:hypothetical protein